MATNRLGPGDFKSPRSNFEPGSQGFLSRNATFFRQVIEELRKVVTPSRGELLNYTLVVLVFVIIVMGIITLLDLLFGWGVSWVFGDGSALFG